MSDTNRPQEHPRSTPSGASGPSGTTRRLFQLGIELVIGLAVAALVVVVAWASSNAISFVYGGY